MKINFTLTKSIKLLLILLFTSGLMLNSEISNAQYTVGDLIVTDGVNSAANNTTFNLIDIKTSGAAQSAGFTTNLPANFRASGSAGTAGYAARSNNGTLYSVTGASSTITTAAVKALNPKAVGTVNNAGFFVVGTTYTGSTANGPIGATSIDNTNWFISDQGGIYTNSATSASPATVLGSIKAFGGTVYSCNVSGPAVGIVSAATGGTFTGLTGVAANANVVDFSLISSGNNGTTYDVLYVLSQTSKTAGIIAKYSLVSGSWTANGTYTTAFGGIGLAAQAGSGSANLYATTGKGGSTLANNLLKLTDAAGYNATISITTANNVTLYTAPILDEIKGIDFAPIIGNISLSPASLSAFTYAEGSGPSVAQSFTVSAVSLTSGGGTITVTGSPHYEVSTDGISFAGANGSVALTYTGTGTISSGTVWVRMISGLTAVSSPYNYETITLTGGGGANSIAASGTVAAASPTITLSPVSPATLGGFNYTVGSGPSAVQTFTVSGVNLTAPVTLNGLTNYEINVGLGYGPTASIGSSGTLAATTVSVRLKAGLSAGNYSETITAGSTGATNGTVALNGSVYSGTFTSGNLAVEVVGNGTSSLSSAASQVSVWEYNTAGVQQNAIPFVDNGTLPASAPFNLTESGSASSAGLMGRSSEGSYDLIAGYNAVLGSASVVSSNDLRTMGYIGSNGVPNSNNAYNLLLGNNVRAVASNGFSFWFAGTPTTGQTLYYFFDPSSVPVALGTVNTNFISIFNGNLYYSTKASGGAGIYQIGTNGLPLSLANTATTQLTDATYATSGDPFEFSINPAGNVMYITDQGSYIDATHEQGGIIKYTKSGSTWSFAYTLQVFTGETSGGATGVTVDWVGDGTHPYIYATALDVTSNNKLVKIIDNGSSAVGSVLATAGADYGFRGVQFTPVTNSAKTVFSTASELDFGAEANGGTTAPQMLNVSGYNLTGNLTITASADYLVSTSSNGTYSTSVTFSGSTVNDSVFVEFNPSTVGTDNGTLTIASSGATNVSVTLTGTGTNPINYYNTANTDLTNPANWGTSTDGSGSNPSDFASAGQVFNVVNPYNTLTSAWTVSGLGSKIVVGDGSVADNLIVPSGSPVTATVDVTANATLTLQDATYPAFGTLATTSTVNFNVNGTNTIPNATYGNLTLTGNTPATDICNLSTSSSLLLPLKVTGNLVVNGVTVLGATVSPNTFMQLSGNLTASNGAIFGGTPLASSSPLFNIITNGNADQTFSYTGGGTIRLFTLTSTKSAGTYTLGTNTTLVIHDKTSTFTGIVFNYSGTASVITQSGSSLNTTGNTANINLTFTGTSSVTLGGNINTSDNSSASYTSAITPSSSLICNFASGTTFADGGNNLQVSNNLEMIGAGTYNLTGTVTIATRTGSSSIESDATSGAIVAQLNNLTISPIAGNNTIIEPATGTSTIVVKGNLTINGTFTGFKLQPNSNIIQVGGNFTDAHTNDAIAAGGSTFEFNGTTSQTISTAFAGGESLFNVKINNANGVQISGAAGILNITGTGNLNNANGVLTTNSGKIILNNTATITESTTSYVVGTVTSTRTLATGTNETFGGMGIEVDALGTAPGSTVATRVTGVSSALGCASSSILRYFTLAPTVNTGLNATIVYHYLPSAFELNNFTPSTLELFNSANNGSTWNALTTISNVGASTLSATAQASLNRYSAGNEQPVGGMVTPINSIVCPSGSVTLTVGGATGNLNWQSSTDDINWSNIPGATNSTYSAIPSVTTNYRSIATFSNCLLVASTSAVVAVSTSTITLSASNITDQTLVLNWSPAGTGNYNITYSGTSSGLLTGVTPPKTITGLTASGAYDITLTQTGASLAGCPASGTISVNTLCSVPTNLTATSPATGQLQVSWNGPAGNYRVYYRPLYSYITFFTKDVTNATSVLLTKQGNNNLYTSGTYQVYVSRLDCPNIGNTGQPTSPVYVTVLPNPVSCATPTIDTVFSTCPVLLEVQMHGSPTNNYNVYIQRLTPTLQAVNSYEVSGGDFTINAVAGEQYLISADSRCIDGSVSVLNIWHNDLTVKPVCDAPANLVLSEPTCHGFSASWNADQCQSNTIGGYALYMRQAGAINYNSYGVALPANGVGPNVVINIIGEGKNMQVFVKSVYNCGGSVTYGPSSQIETISTLSAGCRDEQDAPTLTEEKPAVQQTSPDNSEVFSLYPNPNNGQFEVSLSSLNTDDKQVRVEVMNMLGQTVTTHISTTEGGHYNEYMNLPSSVSSGTYIVRVTVGKNIYTAKVNVSK